MSDLLPLSIVEHYAYCPRQAALIHIEAQWQSNADTARGEVNHDAVDRGVRAETRDGILTWLSLPVWSAALGVHGICDVVEFRDGIPTPVEHKPQLPRRIRTPAELQLVVQALCLEEMFDCRISEAYIFTRRDNRRHPVKLTAELRSTAKTTVANCHDLVDSQSLPGVINDERCPRCSLTEVCGVQLPDTTGHEVFALSELGDW